MHIIMFVVVILVSGFIGYKAEVSGAITKGSAFWFMGAITGMLSIAILLVGSGRI